MMRPMTLSELQTPLSAQLHGPDCEFSGVSTDSRSVQPGDLFVALRGEHFDGHDYMATIGSGGAVAALVDKPCGGSLAQLEVADTQRALGLLGAYNRQLYQAPLIAITGSSGKTTVKNMVQAVLSQCGETLATQGNFNNEIGVPLTLLQLQPDIEYAVVEMGAAKAGDIAWLCQLGQPSVALLLNVLPAHLEGFGSIEGIASAKGEIFDTLGADDVAIINADQPWARQWRKRAGAATVVDFALEAPAAVSARDICLRGVEGVSFTASTAQGEIAIRLALPGRHNVANALATIAVGLACGVPLADIRDGLESLQPVAGRLRASRSPQDAVVIDDSYNANPGSVRAAIDALAACPGRRTLILGAMCELGESSIALHAEIGRYAQHAGIEQFWGVGAEVRASVDAFGTGARFFVDRDAVVDSLAGEFASGDTVLVKGSRSTGMEQVLENLLSAAPERGAELC